MEYNFTNPFSFSWNSSAPFLPNGFPANGTTPSHAAPAPPGLLTQPVASQQTAAVNLLTGFNNDASHVLYPGPRFSGSAGYHFGIN